LDRAAQHRDARLFVVAVEGEETERQYFGHLAIKEIVPPSKVKIHVIPTVEGRSAPEHVLKRLDDFQVNVKPLDEQWLVIDVDRFGASKLASVYREAVAKGYQLAISNPCFEWWLLLHFTEAPRATTSQACEPELRRLLGSFNKSRLIADRYTRDNVALAVERARARDQEPARWPVQVGSHVYRLVTRLLKLS